MKIMKVHSRSATHKCCLSVFIGALGNDRLPREIKARITGSKGISCMRKPRSWLRDTSFGVS